MIKSISNFFKFQVASARWGELKENDEDLLANSSLLKVLNSSQLRKNKYQFNCSTVE